jgi:hypothetical protein
MFVFRKHISRRAVLKGVGATVALPLLDAMSPAATAWAQTPAGSAPKRVAFVGFPHGAVMKHWSPVQTGTGYDMSPILEPLSPFRDHLTIVSGLRNQPAETPEPHGDIGFAAARDAVQQIRAEAFAGVGASRGDHSRLVARKLGRGACAGCRLRAELRRRGRRLDPAVGREPSERSGADAALAALGGRERPLAQGAERGGLAVCAAFEGGRVDAAAARRDPPRRGGRLLGCAARAQRGGERVA